MVKSMLNKASNENAREKRMKKTTFEIMFYVTGSRNRRVSR